MAVGHADVAIESFLELENRLADFVRAVPLDAAHLRTYSPVLASLLLDSCSFIEATLKSTMDNARYDAIPGIAAIRAKRVAVAPPYLTINDLRTVFRADAFYLKRVWFLPRAQGSFPWYEWRRPAVRHPAWWRAYNSVKHDQFENATDARYGDTVHSLEAAFLVLVQSLEFRRRLVERGIVRCRTIGAAALIPIASHWEQLPTPEIVVATTRLFGFKFRTNGSPTFASDISMFI